MKNLNEFKFILQFIVKINKNNIFFTFTNVLKIKKYTSVACVYAGRYTV